MYEVFSVLGLQVNAYGLCLGAAALAALALMCALSRKRGLPTGAVAVFGAVAVPLGIICARAVFCLVNISYFVNICADPLAALYFFDGGLSMYGAVIGAALAAAVSARAAKARFYDVADVLCAPLALFIAAARFAERFTELGVGKTVDAGRVTEAMPWLFIAERAGKSIEYRMAVYRYEAVVALILFAVMLTLFLVGRMRSGDIALCFITLFGASQIVFESLRDDGHMMIIFLRAGQLLAALMPMLAAGAFMRRRSRMLDKDRRRTALTWTGLALCIVLLVLLEFSLDGRLTVGSASPLRDYMIMLAVCAALCILPLSLRRGAAFTEEA